ncbi:MAG: hypothetical protein DCC65_00320 [Planctomycetota bacterium]|nr:MAG: hypothetical protein DCC65_00320 [Planctomycetota bacterium]
MNSVLVVRILRIVGWAALTGSIGVVLGTVLVESLGGPVETQRIWPSSRLWSCFFRSVAMAGSATALAGVIALPATFALVASRPRRARGLLLSMVIMPLVIMPGTFAYAWMLLATRQGGWAARLLDALGWNTPGLEWVQSAWVLATWLWPIPALVVSASFVQTGRTGYQLARLDAPGVLAFVRGAIPPMRAPVTAALAIVFTLAINDSTVPPLMGSGDVWSVEVMAQASAAASRPRPAGYLFWHAWPVIVLVALAAAAAAPGLRAMSNWAESLEARELGQTRSVEHRATALAVVVAVAMTILPIVVFIAELATGRAGLEESIRTAYLTFRRDGLATLIVGLLTAGAAFAATTTILGDPARAPARRFVQVGAIAAAFAGAVLPPELIGTALATFYTRISDPLSRWSVYDCTPFVWGAATFTRYAFFPMAVGLLLNRRVPESLVAQTRLDGSDDVTVTARVRLPFLWKPVAAAALVAGCMALSEVAASVLVQPPRFFGGSLAVRVDMQMHYGRQDETIALALMMLIPAMIGAWLAPGVRGGHSLPAES